ncbi:flavodoxin family protein [Levilactobacillus spicheri]|uniref:NAD(P)H-dependent oxidoreductase n=2 Tax=Levilactobacillus spicheri TaxID=216463 RepID=A0ABQ0WPG6_9LACO|nr:NAD(P)H-dependent oxidoreductase [Levilactobacillus spicheri]KRL48578.1 multimeric flavodoxin WrbA [Levilactobacillus spicheri DSM 15429]GEO66926.1 NAD(P)H-dependent oxidoreductase [Levilactobacillus spicheri]
MTTLFINGSSRTAGNTVALGERLLTDIPHQTIHLIDQHLNFDCDYRDTGHPQADPSDDYQQLMARFATADDIVLGTPVYWYNMTGQLKTFVDRWFDSFTTGFPFAGKRLYLVVVGADDPQHKALGIGQSLQDSCDWLKMTYMGATIVTADGPHDVAQMAQLPADFTALRERLLAATAVVSRETKSN